MIKEITKQRFDALTYAVLPTAYIEFEEVAWFADEGEHFLATIVYDKYDKDWGFIVLARNEKHIFNCIDSGHSFKEALDAKTALLSKLAEYDISDKHIYPQRDGIIEKQDIFVLLASEEKLHPSFVLLKDNEGYTPAKKIIQEIALTFVDPDGVFFKRFQTREFNQRLWELYLYAYLHEEHFEIIREYPSPDYVCKKGNIRICIEATTVNPSLENNNNRGCTDAILKHDFEYCCNRFRNVLIKKLRKEYWSKPHVKNKPFIIAIQSNINGTNSQAIATSLYGQGHKLKNNESGNLGIRAKKIKEPCPQSGKINSGFFSIANCQHISAVLFSNSATISKFNRIGKLAGFGSKRVTMMREGTCFDHNSCAKIPNIFRVEVTAEKYSETWAQGARMLHNPNALHPIDPALFPNIEHQFLENGKIVCRSINKFIPFNSKTIILVDKK